jgi:hypothetical protein
LDPIVLALTIALVGNAVSIFVVVLSNVSASRREQRRLDREDERLERQRLDARVRLARENQWRVIDVQRDYYVDFYQRCREVAVLLHDAGYSGEALAFDWQLPPFESLIRLRVFASDHAYQCAEAVYNALYRWGAEGLGDYETEEAIAYDATLDPFLAATRHDLGIQMNANLLTEDDIIR